VAPGPPPECLAESTLPFNSLGFRIDVREAHFDVFGPERYQPTDPLPVVHYGGKAGERSQRRRCLTPVDNFYEWKKVRTGKQPYAVALADRGLMALAGLWENWRSPAGEWVRSFAIVTTTPNELCAELHNRMPVILARETWPAWLGEEPADLHQLKDLLAPYPSAEMTCWPVSPRVGNVKNNDPSLIEPIILAE